jgi:hypothetical protein
MTTRRYKGKKSKTEQYISRRQAGQSKIEARKRSYLSRSSWYRAEEAYVQTVVDAECARMSSEAQETASRAQAEADLSAQKDDAARRKRLQPVPEPSRPRCRLCGSDHCHCSLEPVSAFTPVAEYGFVDPTIDIDPRFAPTAGDCGLPREVLEAWADSNPGERVENGIWSQEKGFISDGDQAEADFHAQQDAARQRNRDMDKCAGTGPMRTR